MRPWSGRSLLADQARLRAGGLLAGCAILVVVLGVLFAGQGTPDPFDRAVDGPFVTWFAGRQNLAAWLAYPATLVPAGGASLIAALACLARGWLRGAVLALLAVPVTSGLNDAFLKHLFHRTYLGALTYPSGHAAAASALAMSLTVLLLLAPRAAPATRPAGSHPARRRASRARRDRHGARWAGHGAAVGGPGRGVARGRRGRRRRHGPALALLHRHGWGRRPRHRNGLRARPDPRPQLAAPRARPSSPGREPISKDRPPGRFGAKWTALVAKRARYVVALSP